MDAIIMCAGAGTRLRPLTLTVPKPLVPVGKTSPLRRLLDTLPERVSRVILVVGYLGDEIEKAIGNASKGRPVLYVRQETLDGTGGALRRCRDVIHSERFLVLNGDDMYVEEDLQSLVRVPCGLLYVIRRFPRTIDGCTLDREGYLLGIAPVAPGGDVRINVGAYCLDRDWFLTQPTLVPGKANEWSLPHALPELVQRGKRVKAIAARHWMPVGTPEELTRAELWLGDEGEGT